MLREHCISSENASDLFVGIRFRDGIPSVSFPHGFNIAEDEKECRKDIFRLLAVLKRFTEHKDGELSKSNNTIVTSLPITSYQFIIQDFLAHGYYTETEVKYVPSQRGKINWKRTIQQEQAHIDGENVVYLQYQTRTNRIKDDNLITHIHKYCVYQSFYRFGWLYFSTDYLPEEPSVAFNKQLFITTLKQALNTTFNDSKRRLFQSMINIITEQEDCVELKNLEIGVNRFDSVWENLIDYVFGESNKEAYFPHGSWHIIKNGKLEKSSALEPDTVMKIDDKIYVLDAKYYKYGITGHLNDLPATSSIQKQITYGKRIAEQMGVVPPENVYNAFIMPFESKEPVPYKFVSVGTADWESYNKNTKNYAYVLGILMDTKWLISTYTRHNDKEIDRLSNLIEHSLIQYRKMTNQ